MKEKTKRILNITKVNRMTKKELKNVCISLALQIQGEDFGRARELILNENENLKTQNINY